MTSKPSGAAEARAYFSQLQEIFDESAIANGGPLAFDYMLAGERLQLRFAGPSLLPQLLPSLEHLESDLSAPAQLTIHIWDETSSVTAIPPPPWSWESYMSRGEIGAYDRDKYRIWFDIGTGLFSMIDLESSQALLWVRDPDRLPIYVTAAPFRMILQASLSQRGLFFAHAAAVGNDNGAVMLVGEGGSGKSTTSLLCLAEGMDFLGDDYCLFDTESAPSVHSAYCSAKLDPDCLQRLPIFQPMVNPGNDLGEDKALLILHKDFSSQLVSSRPVLAILVPSVTHQEATTIERISALAGIRALAPSTMQQIAGPDARAWRAIAGLARKVPSYRLKVGYDLKQIPGRIESLIEQLV